MDPFLIVLLVVSLYMAWSIGANDTANSVGTSVGSGVLSLRGAIIRIAIFDFLGAVLFGKAVTKTIGKGIVQTNMIGETDVIMVGALSAILAACLWVTFATYKKLPVSTTHSIVGGMLGFGLVVGGLKYINFKVLAKVVASWIISPLVGSIVAFSIYILIKNFILEKVEDEIKVEKVFGYLQIMTAMFVGFSIGSNDVANAVGPVYLVLSMGSREVEAYKVLAYGGFGIVLGTLTWGYRVIETIGRKVTEITPTKGFSAEFSTASIVLANSYIGLPISTTHTLVGSVIGVGFARGIKALDLQIVRKIIVSWIVTVPITALLSAIIFKIFNLLS